MEDETVDNLKKRVEIAMTIKLFISYSVVNIVLHDWKNQYSLVTYLRSKARWISVLTINVII